MSKHTFLDDVNRGAIYTTPEELTILDALAADHAKRLVKILRYISADTHPAGTRARIFAMEAVACGERLLRVLEGETK